MEKYVSEDQYIKEYDLRQLKIMSAKIKGYKSGHLHLLDLIGDLEGLLSVLNEKEEEWEMNFRENWGDLEEVYAVALDDGKERLSLRDMTYIMEALDNLTKLINEKITVLSDKIKDEEEFYQ